MAVAIVDIVIIAFLFSMTFMQNTVVSIALFRNNSVAIVI